MPGQREQNTTLTMRQYEIGENRIDAYFDAAGRLVFVLDNTKNDIKQNVLLVIDAHDGRKWDDILVNDWGVDLETIRPKQNNKYQKLDIEYTGLDVYGELVRAYDADENLSDAVRALVAFRNASVRRSATERLNAAVVAADTARETIARTNDTVTETRARLRGLRAKLSEQKKSIGREPTKQSASKILRTEAQIDAVNEKIRRANRRLDNAQRRMLAADDDAARAREILARLPADNGGTDDLPIIAPTNDLMTITDAPTPAPISETTQTYEPKAEQMADEEVKPLFDKDPEILDEEIAFKPIEFDAPTLSSDNAPRPTLDALPETQQPDTVDVDIDVAPLSFTPPVSPHAAPEPIPERTVSPEPAPSVQSPMLDSLKSVDSAATPTPQPSPVATPAPMPTGVRPVSPMTGAAPIANANDGGQKQNLMYYVMLGLLIVLSIFTLWLYQQRNGDTVPDLAATVSEPVAVVAPVAKTEPVAATSENPFIDDTTDTAVEPVVPVVNTVVDTVTVTEPVAVMEPEPVVVTEPEPITAQPEPEPVPVTPPVPTDTDAVDVTDVVPEPVQQVIAEPTPAPVAETPEPVRAVASDADVIASKPSYNVSQQEKMFVASPSYDTDVVAEYDDVETPVCDDGRAPDKYGCCTGEVYSDLGDGVTACCVVGGDECFPPLN